METANAHKTMATLTDRQKCMFILNMIHKTTLTPIFIKITYNKKVLAGTKKWKKMWRIRIFSQKSTVFTIFAGNKCL